MGSNNKTCSCGWIIEGSSKFCPECGAMLSVQNEDQSNRNQNSFVNIMPTMNGMSIIGMMGINSNNLNNDKQEGEPINIEPDDKDLKLLVNTYSMVRTGAGDRTEEEVLYLDEASGTYQIHSYKSDGFEKNHRGYYISESEAKVILTEINKQELIQYKDVKTISAPGVVRVLKFRDDSDELIRLVEGIGIPNMVSKFSGMLRAYMKTDNMIVPEYAKSWKRFTVSSNSMNMMDCYFFEIERIENNKFKVKGHCFADSRKLETNGFILSTKATEELINIPFGMMISTRHKKQPSMGMIGMVADAPQKSCSIVYGDDRKDSKYVDEGMMRAFLKIMISEFLDKSE